MNTKMLDSLLLQLGLTDKEISVYLAVQKAGKVLPVDLSLATGINRSTVYSVAKELIKKGLLVEDLGDTKRSLIATEPKEIMQLIEADRSVLKERERIAAEAMEQIASISQEALYPVPKIRVVKEHQMEAFLRDRTPDWNASIVKSGGTFLGFQEHGFVEHFEDWIDWYWENAPEEIELHLLTDKGTEAEADTKKKGYTRRHIHVWKPGVSFGSTTWVMGDYVVMFVLSSSPNYLVEIHDARFAQSQRALFTGILQDIQDSDNSNE